MSDMDLLDRPDGHEGLVDAGGAVLTDPAAERQLLGRLMLNPADMMFVSELDETVFSDPLHRRLFGTIKLRFQSDEPITSAALVAALGGDPNVKLPLLDMTTAQYLARLMVDADASIDIEDIAGYLIECADRLANNVVDDYELDANLPFRSTMGLKMWTDQNDPAEDYDFIVEDLIPKNEGVIIIGESGTGKSFLTNHLAMCGARAVPFFGRKILQPFGTIWCAYEAGRGQTARMRAYRKHHNLDLEHLPFAVLTKPMPLWPNLDATPKLIEEFRNIVRTQFRGVPLGMVVFDTYNASTPGASEIDSEVVSKIRGQFDMIRADLGCSSVIVGHTNAVGKHRGNEQLTNNIDTVIVVSRKVKHISAREVVEDKDDDGRAVRTMRVKKQREGQDGEEHDFVLHIVEDGTRNKFGKPRTSCVVAAPNVGDAPTEIDTDKGGHHVGAKVTRQDVLFLECVLEAIDTVGVSTPLSLELPRSISKVVDYDHVKRLVSKKTLREEDNTEDGLRKHREKTKKAVGRARERLQYLKVIGCESPYIWWTGKPVRGLAATQPKDRTLFDDQPQLSDDDIAGLY